MPGDLQGPEKPLPDEIWDLPKGDHSSLSARERKWVSTTGSSQGTQETHQGKGQMICLTGFVYINENCDCSSQFL